MTNQVLGIDWGTSNRRAYLVDAQGRCLRSHSDDRGMLAEQGHFASSLAALLRQMDVGPGTPVIMSGMVGSAQGWREAPYLGTDVPLSNLPRHLVPVPDANRPGRTAIVPGYCHRNGLVDVMRGEETQLLGALALGQGDGWVVLPGTHSKWALIEQGRLVRWATYMTGELYGSLSRSGTLSAMMSAPDARDDPAAFKAGLALARERAPLTHSLFTVRASVVSGSLPAARARSFVSGLLIGAEFVSGLDSDAPPASVALVGSQSLAGRYLEAARYFGLAASVLDPDAAYCAALGQFMTKESS